MSSPTFFIRPPEAARSIDPTDTQVAGDHYKKMAIQPIKYIHANNLSFLEGNVIKYVTRHKHKNKAADIQKAIHYLQLILHFEYPDHDATQQPPKP